MPVQDLIDVRVIVDGEEAIEYEDPDAVDGDKRCVRYVETMPGQQFSINVTWLVGFKICWADALYCLVRKGDEAWKQSSWRNARELKHNQGTLTEPATISLSASILKDPETGKSTWCEWAFEGIETGNLLLFPD